MIKTTSGYQFDSTITNANCLEVLVYMCVYIYIYIYIYTHTHTQTHFSNFTTSSKRFGPHLR